MIEKMAIKILFMLLFVSIFTACITQKKIVYFQEKEPIADTVKIQDYVFHIKSKDLLQIRVISTDDKISSLFSNYLGGGGQGASLQLGGEQSYYFGYQVDDDGFVEIPLVGKIKLAGLTLNDSKILLQDTIRTIVRDAIVNIKPVSFRVTMLGELGSKGIIYANNYKLNIIDAIVKAGDFTQYSNRSKVMVIRQSEGGKIYYFDLTNRKILYSKDFYLMPDDIVYVEPLKIKNFTQNISNYTTILSTVMTTLTSVLLIYSLAK